MSRIANSALPPVQDCAYGKLRTTTALHEVMAQRAARTGSTLEVQVFLAVQRHIAAVEAGPPLTISTPNRMFKVPPKTTISYRLPKDLFRRCQEQAMRVRPDGLLDHPDMRVYDPGLVAPVIRKCISLEFGAAVKANEHLVPHPPQVRTKMEGKQFLLHLTPNIHAWLSAQPGKTVSGQVRHAISTHLEAVVSGGVPFKIPVSFPVAQMKACPIRIPTAMHEALRHAASQRTTTMTTLIRVCVATYVRDTITKAQKAQPAKEAA